MFDSKLFYDLCEKYGVELSDKYSEPMIKVNGEIIPLKEYDFEKCEKLKEKQMGLIKFHIAFSLLCLITFWGFTKAFYNKIKEHGYINNDSNMKYDMTINLGIWSFFVPIMNVLIVIVLFVMIFVKKDDLLKFGE